MKRVSLAVGEHEGRRQRTAEAIESIERKSQRRTGYAEQRLEKGA
jgi:hypothetical protein